MRRLALLVPVLLIAALTAACGSDDSGSGDEATPTPTPAATPTPFKGLPEGVEAQSDSPAGVIVSDTPGVLWVVTYGSSSNPAIAREAKADGQTVTLTVEADPNKPATMDYVPTTSSIALPDSVSLTEPVTIELGQWGSVELADPSTAGSAVWAQPAE